MSTIQSGTDLRKDPLTAGTWSVDGAHTHVGFTVRHLVAAKVRGQFRSFEGTIEIAGDVTDSKVSFSIDAGSIDTGAPDRDNHIRSADFLDIENHPTLDFVSTKITDEGDGRYHLEGDLTIRDTTRPVTLDMEYLGTVSDPWGNTKAMFTASTDIEREEWGLTWNAALEGGGWLVGKTIHIEIELEAAKS